LYNFLPAFPISLQKNALFHGQYCLLIVCFYSFSLRSFTSVHLVYCAPTGSLKVPLLALFDLDFSTHFV
jgi:hypothetical protein